MRRMPVYMLLLLFLCVLFTGCMNHKIEKPLATDSKKKITLLHYFSGTLSGGLQEMVQTFNMNNNSYELVATPLDHEAFKTSIGDTIASSRSPDLYSYWGGTRVASILEKIEPFDDAWNAAHLSDTVSSPVAAACTYNGKKYLLPITQHYVAFFYNKKIFTKVGIEPPTTWTEFQMACEKLKAAGITPISLGAREKWPAQFWFDYLLLRTAGYDYRQRLMEGNASYADAPVRRVFNLWADLIEKGYFNTNPLHTSWDTGATDDVFKGQAAMTLMGTWVIGQYSDGNHKWQPGEDYDYFPFPIIDEGIPRYALGPIDGLILSKNAVQKEGAKEALTYLASLTSLKAMSRGSGGFVPNTRVEEDFYSPMQQRMKKDIEQTPQWVFNYDLATPPPVATVGLNLFTEFLEFPEQREDIITNTAVKIEALWK